MKTITVWKRFNNETKQYEHNHIEDGCCVNPFPTTQKDYDGRLYSMQSSWKNGKWEKTFATLFNNKVIYET